MGSKGKMAAKRKQAQSLYVRNGVLQQDIAEIVGVSEKTISQWKNAEKWDQQRAAMTTTKESELARMYGQLSSLNSTIEGRDQKYPSPGEADTQNKLSAAIAKLEQDTGLSATVNVFMRFTKWLREVSDLDTTKRFGELSDQYIKSLLVE